MHVAFCPTEQRSIYVNALCVWFPMDLTALIASNAAAAARAALLDKHLPEIK